MNGKIIGGTGIVVATLFVMSLATSNVDAAKKVYCYTVVIEDPIFPGGILLQDACYKNKPACE